MTKQMETVAHSAVENLEKGLKTESKQPFFAFVEQVATEKEKMTPPQYKEFLGSVNKELCASLPGLSIEGAEPATCKAHDAQSGGASFAIYSKDHWSMQSHGPRPESNMVLVSNGSVASAMYGDGHGKERKNNSDGSFVEHAWGTKPDQNFNATMSADGKLQVRYADGRVSDRAPERQD